jgi:hypothetical protein
MPATVPTGNIANPEARNWGGAAAPPYLYFEYHYPEGIESFSPGMRLAAP